MGIPSYYKNIIENYPNIVSTKLDLKLNVDNLFFDLNCAIHPCCRNKTDENEMLESIYGKIVECIKISKVKKLVYIAIDGPAPKMKMEQQRQRRLKSALENKIWDTNQITPGTQFMNNLNIYLKGKIVEMKLINKMKHLKFIISDSNEPGEGEHKLMNIIDSLPINDINVIYGLDADLIMLSMIRDHKIFLLRETTDYNIENVDSDYIYCNIDLLKYYIIQDLKSNQIKINDTQLLFDYLFMCFLLGNDFIINSPSLILRYNGLNSLQNTYHELQSEYFGNFYLLKENKQIDFHNFKLFIQKLASNESSSFNNILNIRNKQENGIQRRNYKKDSDDYKLHDPIINRKDEKIIFNNLENYHRKYNLFNFYNTHDYNPSYDQLLNDNIQDLCFEYMKSLSWTVFYYFHKKTYWTYHFPYHFSPLLSDLHNYLENTKDNFDFKNDKPYSSAQQLKIVLPFQDNSYKYPKITPTHSLLKRYNWECHPILPPF